MYNNLTSLELLRRDTLSRGVDIRAIVQSKTMNKEEQILLDVFQKTTNHLAQEHEKDITKFSFNEHYLIFENKKWIFFNMYLFDSEKNCKDQIAKYNKDIIAIPITTKLKGSWNYGLWKDNSTRPNC